MEMLEASRVANRGSLDEEAVSELLLSMVGDLAPTSWEYLSELFNRQYWTRTWCVQEVAAASWAIVLVEELEIPLLELLSSFQVMLLRRGETLFAKPFRLWNVIYLNGHPQSRISEVVGSIGDLLQALELGRPFQATDPRDKFFALIGVCDEGLDPILALTQTSLPAPPTVRALRRALSNDHSFLESIRPPNVDFYILKALRPDYSKDIVTVYTDLTRLLMHKPRMLDVLDHVQHNEDPSTGQYPSWVPKWYEQPSCHVMKDSFFAGLCGDYFAQLHDSPLDRQSARPEVLSLDGFHVDVIHKVSDVMDLRSTDVEYTIAIFERIWAQLYSFPMFAPNTPPYRNGESHEVAFCNAMVACPHGIIAASMFPRFNLGRLPTIRPPDYERGAGPYTQKCQREIENFLTYLALRESGDVPPGMTSTLLCVMNALHLYSLNRRAFLTRNGRVGIGPKMMQPGDEVVVFFGGRLPFVIRPWSDYHVFVGDCYLRDGQIMLGAETEKIKFNKPGVWQVVTFNLR